MKCKNCKHEGDMHSNEYNTHIGECYIKLEDGSFCHCKEFVNVLTDESGSKN